MSETTLLFLIGFLLLGIGWYGLMVTHNLLRIIMVLQIMVKAVLLMLIAAGNASGQLPLAQSLAVAVIAADTMVAVVGLALAVQTYRRTGTMDMTALTRLRG